MPQAIMDHRNSPIKWDEIDACITTERRARGRVRHFGLAYELWAKDPLKIRIVRNLSELQQQLSKGQNKKQNSLPTQTQSAAT